MFSDIVIQIYLIRGSKTQILWNVGVNDIYVVVIDKSRVIFSIHSRVTAKLCHIGYFCSTNYLSNLTSYYH